MVGMARQNENSAAERLSAPNSIADTIVAPERDTPGTMAKHWNTPIARYSGNENTDLTMSQQKPNGLLSLGRWTAKA